MSVNRLFELEGLVVVYGAVDSPLERNTSVSTPKATTNLWYDCEDRLTSLTGNGLADGFSSNVFDTRVQKSDAVSTHNYMRDGAGATGSLLSDGASTFNPGISERTNGSTTVNHLNYQGSVTAQTAPGITYNLYAYDAFGNLTTGDPSGPFGFAGGYWCQSDSDTGLQLLGHRYYDPSIGRFITRDPTQNVGNWFNYVKNNPGKSVDPTGLVEVIQGWYDLGADLGHGFLISRDNDKKSNTFGKYWTFDLQLNDGKGYIYEGEFTCLSGTLKNVDRRVSKWNDNFPYSDVLENDKNPVGHSKKLAEAFLTHNNKKPHTYKYINDNCNTALATLEHWLRLFDGKDGGYEKYFHNDDHPYALGFDHFCWD